MFLCYRSQVMHIFKLPITMLVYGFVWIYLVGFGRGCTNWTRFFDRDDPTGREDYEGTDAIRKENPQFLPCELPVDIDVRLLDGRDYKEALEVVYMNASYGFVCRNEDQNDNVCEDYKVRFCCDAFPSLETSKLPFATSLVYPIQTSSTISVTSLAISTHVDLTEVVSYAVQSSQISATPSYSSTNSVPSDWILTLDSNWNSVPESLTTSITTSTKPVNDTMVVSDAAATKEAVCDCQCYSMHKLVEIKTELAIQIRRNLTLVIKNLSKTRRSKTSALDDRPLAILTGYTGLAVLLLLITTLVSFDLVRAVRFLIEFAKNPDTDCGDIECASKQERF